MPKVGGGFGNDTCMRQRNTWAIVAVALAAVLGACSGSSGDDDDDDAWEPPSGEVRTMVHLELNIDQHGATPVTLACELEDTGSATVPGTLTDALFNAGISGFPRGSIVRRTVDSQAVADGCIELVVASPRTQSVTVVNPWRRGGGAEAGGRAAGSRARPGCGGG